jgi:hypothetical protein
MFFLCHIMVQPRLLCSKCIFFFSPSDCDCMCPILNNYILMILSRVHCETTIECVVLICVSLRYLCNLYNVTFIKFSLYKRDNFETIFFIAGIFSILFHSSSYYIIIFKANTNYNSILLLFIYFNKLHQFIS